MQKYKLYHSNSKIANKKFKKPARLETAKLQSYCKKKKPLKPENRAFTF